MDSINFDYKFMSASAKKESKNWDQIRLPSWFNIPELIRLFEQQGCQAYPPSECRRGH